MASDPTSAAPYSLSFTSGSLLMRETAVATPLYLEEHDWTEVRALIERQNLLQARTPASGQRRVRETVQRLQVLTDPELEFLEGADSEDRGYLLWVAACRRYALIGEFAEDVLRERFLLLGTTIDHNDFDGFIRERALWHDELSDLKASTLRKLRATLFRMLIEAGLLSEKWIIQPVLLSEDLLKLLNVQSPSDIRFFPAREGTA